MQEGSRKCDKVREGPRKCENVREGANGVNGINSGIDIDGVNDINEMNGVRSMGRNMSEQGRKVKPKVFGRSERR